MKFKMILVFPVMALLLALPFASHAGATGMITPQIAAGWNHTVGLKFDGTVITVGWDNPASLHDVGSWSDIIQIEAGKHHTVGLNSDGTVEAVGSNSDGQLIVTTWTDMIQVSAGYLHTVGLASDKTVTAIGWSTAYQGSGENANSWTDIIQVAAGGAQTLGLKSDGTVLAAGLNDTGRCNVTGWTDIVQVAAGGYHSVGLRSDGTVVATAVLAGKDRGQSDVGAWTDIVQVSAGEYHTVGLKSDGTVVSKGWNNYGQLEVSTWTDIVQVEAGEWHTVGLKKYGTLVAVGDNNYGGQCNIEDWCLLQAHFENWDSYASGADVHGLGGWKGWDNDPAYTAYTSNIQSLSSPNSIAIAGYSDLVHEYSGYDDGMWCFTAFQFVPSNHTGESFFILLNEYNDGGSYSWSTQVLFDYNGEVLDLSSGNSLPLIKGQWVEIRVEIDLETNLQKFYYGGILLYECPWTVMGGPTSIGAIDLYANGSSTVYYDNLSLVEIVTNLPPVALDDAYTTGEDTPLNVAEPGVLGNDSDANGDPLTAVLVTSSSDGVLELNADGSFSYEPNLNFNGVDSFTYVANDGVADSNVITATITVYPVIVSGLYYEYYEGDWSMLPDFDTLTPVKRGVAENFDIPFNPSKDYFAYRFIGYIEIVTAGDYTFYTRSDDGSQLYIGTTLVVDNDGLHGTNQEMSGTTSLSVGPHRIMVTYFEAYGANSLYVWYEGPGIIKQLVPDSVLYRNRLPIANDDRYEVDRGDTLTVTAPGVLGNDIAVENEPLNAVLVDGPAYAAGFTLNADGSFNYTHDGSETTSDKFTYKANDVQADSNTATVTITVYGENGIYYEYYEGSWSVLPDFDTLAPVRQGLTVNFDIPFDTSKDYFAYRFRGYIEIVTAGDYTFYTLSDDGSQLYIGTTLVVDNDGLHAKWEESGTISLSVGRHPIIVTYFEAREVNYLDVLYQGPGISQQLIPDSVLYHNRLPIANDDSATTDEDTPVTIDVLANDSDADGDVLTVSSFTDPANGAVVDNGDGTVTYTPDPDYNGTDSFEYTVDDGNYGTDMATVTITVDPVNDPPVANDDSATTDEDTPVTIDMLDMLANDSDIDGDVLTVLSFTDPANGAVVDNGDGTVTYTPDPDYNGTDSFEYTVDDGNGGMDTANVVITVNPVNDSPVADPNGPYSGVIGVPLAFNGSNSYDSDGTIVSYEWDYGDASPGTGVAPTHIYATAGTYTVILTVTDDDDATASEGTTCTIVTPQMLVEILKGDLDDIELPEGIKKGLLSKLGTASKVLGDLNQKNDVAAVNVLQAFINQVEAQRGKKISESDADKLINRAQEIILVLSGGA